MAAGNLILMVAVAIAKKLADSPAAKKAVRKAPDAIKWVTNQRRGPF